MELWLHLKARLDQNIVMISHILRSRLSSPYLHMSRVAKAQVTLNRNVGQPRIYWLSRVAKRHAGAVIRGTSERDLALFEEKLNTLSF